MKKLSVLLSALLVIMISSCSKSPISGLAEALDAYANGNGSQDAIEAEATKLDGTTISVANDEISEIEPLKLTLVQNGSQPKFKLNGKFKIEKDIELDVWNEWHANQLKTGELARVDLASPKVEEEGVMNDFKYTPLAFVSAIPVSVENGVIIAKAGTIIEIKDAEWIFRPEKRYCEEYKQASEIWLQPVGIVAEIHSEGTIH